MGVEIEGLEFQIEASSDKGVKSIDTLVETLKKLKRAAKGNNAMSEVTEQLNKLDIALSTLHNEKIEKLTSSLESLGRLGNIKISATLPKRINEIADSIHSITSEDVERMQNLSNAFEKMSNANIPKFNLGKGRATTTGSAEEPLVPQDSGVETATSQIVNATDRVNIFKQALSGVSTVFGKTKGIFEKIKSLFKDFGRAVATTTKPMRDFAKVAIKLPMLVGRRLANQVKQTTSAFGNFFSSLKRIAFYRMIRFIISSITQGFKDGMANLYQYSLIMGTDFAKSMDKLATSALYLKNSLGAMVSPLINALAPAIEFVIDKFVDLLNVINQVIAKLSGNTTYTAARKVATSWQEAADDTKKAVDEIKRYTLGFDELNILGKNNSDSSKGKENTTDYASMFEERPIESSIGDFTNRLKEMVLSGDWESIGRTIGDKINYAVDHIEWAGTGTKIGTGINGAVKSVYYLLDTINFTNIGSKIATLFNNALSAIDFEFVGRLIVKPFTSIADLIIGVIENTDFGLVARKLSDGIKGIFNEASDWLNKVDWNKFGKSLYKDLKDIFTNIDYAGLASSFFRLLGSAIRAAAITIGSFFGSLIEDIKKWWNEDIEGETWTETAWNLLKAIGRGFVNIGSWVYDNIISPLAEALFDADISEIEDAGGNMISGFLQGIVDIFVDIKTWLKEHIVNPLIDGICDWFGIHSPSTVMNGYGGFMADGLLNGLAAPFKAIGTWVKEHILNPIQTAFSKAGLVLEAAVSLVKKGWTTLKDFVGEIGSKAFGLAKSGWTTISNYVGDIGSKAFKLAKDGWSTISSFVGNIGSKAFSLAKSGWTTLSSFVGNIGSKAFSLAKSGWSTISSFVGNIGSKAFSLAKSGWTTISSFVGNIGSKAFSLAKSGWSTISSFVGNIGTKVFSLGKSGWTTISSFVGNIGSKAFNLLRGSNWKEGITNFVGNIASRAFNLKRGSNWLKGISDFVGDVVDVTVNLIKGDWSILRSFGLANGGIVTSRYYKDGGVINTYAGGVPSVNHGSMFIAGESGSELVGHINGRTEVLNRFQLASVMHKSVVDGMLPFITYITNLENKMAQCTNALISTNLVNTNTLNGTMLSNGENTENVNEWVKMIASRDYQTSYDDNGTDTITEGVRSGVNEASARQNELLREQNDLLRQILAKETSVEITTNSFTKAINRKNQRDGKTIIPVGT